MAEGSPLKDGKYLWLFVPVLSWGGILAGLLIPFSPPYLTFGAYGCTLASLAIAALALRKKKKDIVSLCVPIFALLIFIIPLETRPELPMEIVYAATITALVIRLEKRFH
jgi:hypothetical protein